MKKILFLLLFISVLVIPVAASAQFTAAKGELDTIGKGANLSGDLTGKTGILVVVLQGALSLVGTIFLLLTVYAGFLWMTAQGNEEKVTKAKDIVTQTVIGLAITLGAYAITAFVTGKLASGPTSGGGDGGGGGTPPVITCSSLGGACVNIVSGENPCDPSGSDPYSGSALSGPDCTATQQCCDLKPTATKCSNMGGIDITGDCPKGIMFLVDGHGAYQDENCCNSK